MADGRVSAEFSEFMFWLAEAYPSYKLRENTVLIYGAVLCEFSIAQLRAAAMASIRESAYFPTVAELRKHIVPSGEDRALLAWTALARAAQEHGAYKSIYMDASCKLALTVVFGSWPQYCDAEGPAVGARRLEFLAAYRDARRALGASADSYACAPGLCEADNTARGLASGPDPLVGRILPSGAVDETRANVMKAIQGHAVNRLTSGGEHG